MSEPQIWFDLVRKAVKSEEEGIAIMSSPKAMEVMRLTCEAVLNRHAEAGVQFTQVHAGEPKLVVNTKREGVYAEYSHFVEVLTTALRHEVQHVS